MFQFVAKLSLLFDTASLLTGCGSGRPDPRLNPDFNESAAADPGSVKMGSSSKAPGKK